MVMVIAAVDPAVSFAMLASEPLLRNLASSALLLARIVMLRAL